MKYFRLILLALTTLLFACASQNEAIFKDKNAYTIGGISGGEFFLKAHLGKKENAEILRDEIKKYLDKKGYVFAENEDDADFIVSPRYVEWTFSPDQLASEKGVNDTRRPKSYLAQSTYPYLELFMDVYSVKNKAVLEIGSSRQPFMDVNIASRRTIAIAVSDCLEGIPAKIKKDAKE